MWSQRRSIKDAFEPKSAPSSHNSSSLTDLSPIFTQKTFAQTVTIAGATATIQQLVHTQQPAPFQVPHTISTIASKYMSNLQINFFWHRTFPHTITTQTSTRHHRRSRSTRFDTHLHGVLPNNALADYSTTTIGER
jgi:hypothetical protein